MNKVCVFVCTGKDDDDSNENCNNNCSYNDYGDKTILRVILITMIIRNYD